MMTRVLNVRPFKIVLTTAMLRSAASVLAITAPLLLSACASTDPATGTAIAPGATPAPGAAPAPVARPAAVIMNTMDQRGQAAIAEANKQFTAGDFKAVVVTLNTSKAIDFSSTATQVQAHKLLAFSYCITKKTSLCNAEAQRVMVLDPTFQLSEAERSHPMWGPAFAAARKKVAPPAKP
jgi:uncharacterized lipoprotein YajG